MRLPDGTCVDLVEDASRNLTVIVRRGTLRPRMPTGDDGEVAWYIPHTAVHRRTSESAPASATWIDVSGSPIAYYAALLEIWGRGQSFAVLEHDVICRPDIVVEFEACPEPWCTYGYSDWCHEGCREGWRNALGCTRFRRELLERVPDAVSSIPRDNWDWHNVCDGLGNNLRAAGFSHHWHSPPAEHHRETHRI